MLFFTMVPTWDVKGSKTYFIRLSQVIVAFCQGYMQNWAGFIPLRMGLDMNNALLYLLQSTF